MTRNWFTASILVVAMLGGTIGLGAHESEGSCAMTRIPDCCKKAQSASNTNEASMARLCCNLNCSEPGSGGTTTSSSVSPQQGTASPTAMMPTVSPFNRLLPTARYLHADSSHDSTPKYIQHLALLI